MGCNVTRNNLGAAWSCADGARRLSRGGGASSETHDNDLSCE